MPEVLARMTLGASLPRTWEYVTDFATMHTWFFGVRQVTLRERRPAVGVQRTLTLVTGQSHLERIAEWAPPVRFAIEVLQPPVFTRDFRGEIQLAPVGRETVIEWRLSWCARFGPVGQMFNALLVKPVVAAALRLSLWRLRRRLAGSADA